MSAARMPPAKKIKKPTTTAGQSNERGGEGEGKGKGRRGHREFVGLGKREREREPTGPLCQHDQY